MSKSKVVVWVVNDEEYEREALTEDILASHPHWAIHTAEDLFEARKLPAPDYILIDMSAVCPLTMSTHAAYSPICNTLANYPGATIVIVSAVGKTAAMDVRDDIHRVMPEARVVVPSGGIDYLVAARLYFADLPD